MTTSIQLDESLIGRKFSKSDPNIEYVCTGFAQNETFIVFGALNDPTTTLKFTIKSFKLNEVTFSGQYP